MELQFAATGGANLRGGEEEGSYSRRRIFVRVNSGRMHSSLHTELWTLAGLDPWRRVKVEALIPPEFQLDKFGFRNESSSSGLAPGMKQQEFNLDASPIAATYAPLHSVTTSTRGIQSQ